MLEKLTWATKHWEEIGHGLTTFLILAVMAAIPAGIAGAIHPLLAWVVTGVVFKKVMPSFVVRQFGATLETLDAFRLSLLILPALCLPLGLGMLLIEHEPWTLMGILVLCGFIVSGLNDSRDAILRRLPPAASSQDGQAQTEAISASSPEESAS